MFTHLFKLIWNKKRQNFLLLLEIFVSFIVLFVVFTLVVYYYNNFHKKEGFEPSDVWVVELPQINGSADSVILLHQTLEKSVRSMKEVKDMSYASWKIPYYMGSHLINVSYNGKKTEANSNPAEFSYNKVLGLTMQSGRWFQKEDASLKQPGAVINEYLKDKLFGKEDALGKLVDLGNVKMKIVGVVNNYKSNGDYIGPGYNIYMPIDTGDYMAPHTIMIKVSSDADVAFESRLHKLFSNNFKNTNIEIVHLPDKRIAQNKLTLVPIIILLVICGFLIFNVALGLFGILWYNINKRRSEIGLRRAIGATGNSISKQLVSETMVLATFSLIVGIFFAVQFPLLNVFDLPSNVYTMAIWLSVVFIYLLVILCSFYPGKQAAGIHPAIALHEE